MDDGMMTAPTLDQKLYLVLSVALATVAFFINSIQIVIFVYHELVRNARNILLLNQAVAGLVTTFAVVYPIKLITSVGEHSHPVAAHRRSFFGDDFAACYLLASGSLVLAVFSALTNFTVMVLEQYLHLAQPRCYLRFQTDWRVSTSCIVIAWFESILLSALPYLGWNRWQYNDPSANSCILPGAWATGYLGTLVGFYTLHLVAIGYMFSKMYWIIKRQLFPVHHLTDELPVTLSGSSLSIYSEISSTPDFDFIASDAKLRMAAFAFLMLCHLPMILQLLVQAICRDYSCSAIFSVASLEHQSFIWASLLVVVHSAVSPLLYVFAEEQLTKATVCFLRLCCCPADNDEQNPEFQLQ